MHALVLCKLLFCVLNGAVFILWIIFVLQVFASFSVYSDVKQREVLVQD